MAGVFCGSLICRLLEKETGITWKWSVGEESNLAREVQLKKAVIPPLVLLRVRDQDMLLAHLIGLLARWGYSFNSKSYDKAPIGGDLDHACSTFLALPWQSPLFFFWNQMSFCLLLIGISFTRKNRQRKARVRSLRHATLRRRRRNS